MTINEAIELLEEVKNIGGSKEAVFNLSRVYFQSIITRYGEAQYTFYKAGMLAEEAELIDLEVFYHERQFLGL